MEAIKIGDQLIPILDTYESPNGPSGLYPYQLPNNERPTYDGPAMDYYLSTFKLARVIRDCDVATFTGSHMAHDQIYLRAGSTDLHNGASYYLENPELPTPSYPVSGAQWRGRWMTGTTTDYTFENSLTASGFPNWPGSGVTWERQTKLFAVRIKYTSNPGYFNYLLYTMTRLHEISSTYDRSSYTMSPALALNMNYWRRDDIEAYYEEEEIPEDPEPFEPSDDIEYPDTPPLPDSSDVIDIPSSPPIGVTGAGFINVYNPAIGMLTGLGDILFPSFSTPSDVVDAIAQLYDVIANQNLINYVIDCHVIPVTPLVGSAANIKVGYRDTGISVPKVTSDYVDATCGSLSLAEFFHGFQDYASTRSKIYLPFIGFVDTKPEYWQAGTISVDYKFNVIDGSFMAYIRSVSSKSALNGSVIAQYSGNACMHFPLTGINYANMVSGIVGAVGGAVSNPTISGIFGGAWSAVNTLARGGDVMQSNSYNSTASLLGVREAFLLIERPVPAYPSGYAHDKGYPSNITTALSGVSGFTTIEDIDLSGIPLTQTELDELRGLLKEGVYF